MNGSPEMHPSRRQSGLIDSRMPYSRWRVSRSDNLLQERIAKSMWNFASFFSGSLAFFALSSQSMETPSGFSAFADRNGFL